MGCQYKLPEETLQVQILTEERNESEIDMIPQILKRIGTYCTIIEGDEQRRRSLSLQHQDFVCDWRWSQEDTAYCYGK